MKGIDPCFEKLYEILSPNSDYYNDFIHLKMRYQRITDEQNKGVVSTEDKNLELNKIQIALIENIDKLKEVDFGGVSEINSIKMNSKEKFFNHFWKPFFENKTTIVFGTYHSDKFRSWEASNLMSTGDGLTIAKMMGILNKVGVKEIDIVPTFNFTGDRYQNNLILIGGPDANTMTNEMYNKMDTNLKFGNLEINELTLYDSKNNSKYFSSYDNEKNVTSDYGLAFKTKNPYNTDANVIIVAGCFGFGTCAASQIFESSKLLGELEISSEYEFEALVNADVLNGWVQKPKLIKSYKL